MLLSITIVIMRDGTFAENITDDKKLNNLWNMVKLGDKLMQVIYCYCYSVILMYLYLLLVALFLHTISILSYIMQDQTYGYAYDIDIISNMYNKNFHVTYGEILACVYVLKDDYYYMTFIVMLSMLFSGVLELITIYLFCKILIIFC